MVKSFNYKEKAIRSTKTFAVLGLLNGALVWGLIWYPMRLLQGHGVSAEMTSFLIYLVAWVLGSAFFRRAYTDFGRHWKALLLIGFSAGWVNLAYGLALVHGEVMRVLLLFYLAPLWTVLLARLMLDEVLTRYGYAVIALSLGGALTMLKQPDVFFPIPQNGPEWLGLSAGIAFAWTNVLSRRHAGLSLPSKSLAVSIGVMTLALLVVLWRPAQVVELTAVGESDVLLLLALGLTVWIATVTVQYGLRWVPSNQAIVILLFELVVAAGSSYWLTDEALTMQEWIGAMMIIAASIFSGKLEARPAGIKSRAN